MPGIDETADSFRVRQRDPGDFQKDAMEDGATFNTITITDGVKAVIGILKTNMKKGDHTMPRTIEELTQENIELKAQVKDITAKFEEAEEKAEQAGQEATEAKEAQEKAEGDAKEATERAETAEEEVAKQKTSAEMAKDTAFVEGLIKDGKLKPEKKDETIAVLSGYPTEAVKFSRDGKEGEESAKELFKKTLADAPAILNGDESFANGQDKNDADKIEKLTRERMEKTGESYSVASRNLLNEKPELNNA